MVENELESVAEEILNVEEVNNNAIDSVDDTRHNLNDEHQKIVEGLNEITFVGKTSDGIMFKKVDKKTMKVQTDGVNDVIKYFKSKNMDDLVKAASVNAELKKIETRRKLVDKRLERGIGIEEETKK